MRSSTLALLVLAVGVAALSMPGDALLAVKGEGALRISVAGRSPLRFLAALVGTSDEGAQGALERENAALRAELAELKASGTAFSADGVRYRTAPVLSTYPFSTQTLLTVAAGARDGLTAGMPVTLGTSVLVGVVAEVRERTSVVRTVLDPGWEFPVAVGAARADGLFVGGRRPRVTLLVDTIGLEPGAAVISTGDRFPYGLTIGTIGALEVDDAKTFGEADVSVPYELGALRTVSIRLEP